jgi:predicted metal-binding membrane protein
MTSVATAVHPARRRSLARPVLLAITAAWLVAIGAELTGASEALHHDVLIEGGPPLWAALALFLLAWQAMVAAMMLPSSMPLIRLFEGVSAKQERPGRARAAFLAGYVAVWTAFGAFAFVGDVVLHRTVEAIPWLHERPWLIGGSVLVLAGAFQFTDLKEQCLSKCRMPGPFLLAHYRRGAAGGFRLGFGHGLFCLGCCWALMFVMFAAGVAVLWWMAALTAVMIYEKTGRHGAALTPVVGVVLIGLGVVAFAHPTWFPAPFSH